MGTRALGVAGIVALAVLGAVWYAAGAPARSAAGLLPAEISVSAVEAGSGTWVRYLVTVRNSGDSEFAGKAFLLNRAPAAVGPSAVPGAVPQVPRSIPRFPAAAPDAAYQVVLRVGPRQARVLTLVAPDRYATVAVAQDPGGGVVASATVDRSAYAPVAVLTTSQAVVDQLQGVHFDDLVLRLAEYSAAGAVPASLLGYAPYAAVVVDVFDLGALTGDQRAALRDYVGQGGALIVAGGAQWRRTLESLPPELAPLRAAATSTARMGPVLALAGRPGDPVATVALATLGASARLVVAAADGRPLVAEQAYGLGTSVALAFDPAVEPAGSLLPGAAWTEAVGRALSHPFGQAAGSSTMPGVSASTAVEFPPLRPAALPSPWLVGPLLLVYMLLVAPLNYLLLRRRLRRTDLFWVTAPLIAITFTAGFYGLGAALQGEQADEQLQVLKLGPRTAAAEIDYHRIVFLHRGDHRLESTQPALAAPLTFDLTDVSSPGCGPACGLPLEGLRSGAEHVIPAARPVVLEQGVVYGGVRILAMASTAHPPIALESHLKVAADGRVTGELTNRGDRPLRGVALYALGSGAFTRTPLAIEIAPRATVGVDALRQPWDGDPNSPLPGSRLLPDAATRLSRAVGLDAIGRSDRAFLVGFTDPLPGGLRIDGAPARQVALTVFQAPAQVEEAGGAVGDFAIRRLAASSGDRAHGGFLDVYDLALPGRLPAALEIAFDKTQFPDVEVFDWSTGGWRTGGWEDDSRNLTRLSRALRASELLPAADGGSNLLRVRAREQRIGWGAGLYVSEAGNRQ